MGSMREMDQVEVERFARAAGARRTAAGWVLIAACVVAAAPAVAQSDADQRTGVSHPSSAPITVDADEVSPAPRQPAKPSAAIPATAATGSSSQTVYGPYVPYRPAGSAAQVSTSGSANTAFDPDAAIVTEATAGRDQRRLLQGPDGASKRDEDAGIVTYVPSRAGEIPEGTVVKARLGERLSTLTTRPGTRFTATVSEPVMRDGRVMIPVGSVVEGRVTWVRGGKRIGGSAAIHMEPRSVTLPDGTLCVLRARVIDTSSWENTKVDDEGTITRGENNKRNAGIMALTTGGGAAAGAMMAGPAGALVGAGLGAGVSTIVWLRQDRQAELPRDLGLVFSLTEPMSVPSGNTGNAAFAPAKALGAGGQ